MPGPRALRHQRVLDHSGSANCARLFPDFGGNPDVETTQDRCHGDASPVAASGPQKGAPMIWAAPPETGAKTADGAPSPMQNGCGSVTLAWMPASTGRAAPEAFVAAWTEQDAASEPGTPPPRQHRVRTPASARSRHLGPGACDSSPRRPTAAMAMVRARSGFPFATQQVDGPQPRSRPERPQRRAGPCSAVTPASDLPTSVGRRVSSPARRHRARQKESADGARGRFGVSTRGVPRTCHRPVATPH